MFGLLLQNKELYNALLLAVVQNLISFHLIPSLYSLIVFYETSQVQLPSSCGSDKSSHKAVCSIYEHSVELRAQSVMYCA
jgi:hypothetical protein